MDPKQRIASIEKRLREANNNLSQIQGRYESAKENLASVEKECRDRKIDPDKIDEVIQTLEERLQKAATKLESDITNTEQALAPFLGEAT
jgi:chromosome segregation ATPase